MEKDTQPSEALVTCWICEKRKQYWQTRPTVTTARICHDCDDKIKRKKPPKSKPNCNLTNYIKRIENGLEPPPYKVVTKLVNGIKIIGPVPLADVGPLR